MVVSYFLKSVIVIAIVTGIFYPIVERYNNSDNRIYKTCQFVFDRVIPIGANLTEWLHDCRKRSRSVSSDSTKIEKQLEIGNAILSELKISHLELFSEKESDAIWTDTDLENGIEARFMDGELVITRVYPQGEAKKKGLQRGDRIVLAENESLSPYELNHWKGKLKIARQSATFQVQLEPKFLAIQRDMAVADVNGVKVVSVDSFKSQYFSDEKLSLISSKISKTDKVVIDLRNNNGGNFVAGLRFLSLFICEPSVVGYMKKNRNLGRVGFFENDLKDESQIETLGRFDSVALQTFPSSKCLPKPSAILMDALSKSTAEWVGLAFREMLNTPVYGATSAGELLVGIWYDVANIWKAPIKLSIPEAYYESVKGFQIEGHGISVDQTLYPRRVDFERGLDSEVEQVIQAIFRQ